MKKVLLFFIVFFSPLLVFADDFNVYNAKVINKNGISYKGWTNNNYVDKKVNYNTSITVSIENYYWYDESTKQNKHEKLIYGYYDEDWFAVNFDDVILDKNNFTCSICKNEYGYYNNLFYEKNTNNNEIKILNEKGLDLLVGPASDFNSTGIIIPYNSNFKVNYFLGLGGLDNVVYWANIDYNGVNGFVNLYDSDSIFYSNNYIYMTTQDTDINFKDKTVGTIKANTEISPNYISGNYTKFFINYEGVSGFIDSDKLAYGMTSYNDIKIKYSHKLYSTSNKNANVITNIPAGTQISYRFRYFSENDKDYLDCVYTKYNEIYGWICFDKGEIPEYVEHNYHWNFTTPTTSKQVTTDATQNKQLVDGNSLNLILICTIIIFGVIIIKIIARNIILKKKKEKYLEEISKVEEDTD